MIKIENIYWMLAYAFRSIDIDTAKKVNSESFENIYDLFCVMLTQGLNRQVKRGLHRDYIEERESLAGLKGKILLTESIKVNSFSENKLICEFDEYSENNYLNQIVKTAACYIINSKKVIDKNKQNELKKVLQYFKNIDTLNIRSIQWNKVKYNRNNASYKFLINISKFILESMLVSKKSGEVEFLDFIDDQQLHRLFEKFILEYYKYHYQDKGFYISSPQIDWKMDGNSMIEMLPIMQTDIVIEANNKTLIIDAKYYSKILQKQYDKETFRNNNLYQIISYVKNADYNNTGNVMGMLLYAKTDSDNIGWNEEKILNNIYVLTELDLTKDFETVQKKMERIVIWLKER